MFAREQHWFSEDYEPVAHPIMNIIAHDHFDGDARESWWLE